MTAVLGSNFPAIVASVFVLQYCRGDERIGIKDWIGLIEDGGTFKWYECPSRPLRHMSDSLPSPTKAKDKAKQDPEPTRYPRPKSAS